MARLTPKELHHLAQIHEKFLAGTFDETDVHAAIVLLRFQSGKGDVRDLGDSIVHSERDRGRFFDRIRANQDMLNNLNKKSGHIDAHPIITANTFAANLNAVLSRLKLTELSLTRCDAVLLCGLSLAQGGSMKSKGESEMGKLSMRATADAFWLDATMPVTYEGSVVPVTFPVAQAPNEWLPVCNPRATLDPSGLVEITVTNGKPKIQGFEPFMVYIERAPAIGEQDMELLLTAESKLRRTATGLEYVADSGEAMPLTFDGQRLTVPGLPNYFHVSSEFAKALQRISQRLGACVHDDSGAHWFLAGMKIPPDGFHSHWVGAGSATCTRPA